MDMRELRMDGKQASTREIRARGSRGISFGGSCALFFFNRTRTNARREDFNSCVFATMEKFFRGGISS